MKAKNSFKIDFLKVRHLRVKKSGRILRILKWAECCFLKNDVAITSKHLQCKENVTGEYKLQLLVSLNIYVLKFFLYESYKV